LDEDSFVPHQEPNQQKKAATVTITAPTTPPYTKVGSGLYSGRLVPTNFVELLVNPINKSGQPLKHFLSNPGKASFV
jgi:hypothetical protein